MISLNQKVEANLEVRVRSKSQDEVEERVIVSDMASSVGSSFIYR